jgi:hypothetical protein
MFLPTQKNKKKLNVALFGARYFFNKCHVRLKASEMTFLRRTAGYTLLDHKKNEYILQDLNTTPVLENITKC